MRFPIILDDPNDFGAALFRLYKKMAPGQVRMYCYPVGVAKSKNKAYKMMNKVGDEELFFLLSVRLALIKFARSCKKEEEFWDCLLRSDHTA